MRLIDADKLILHLNDYALQEAPFRGESADTYNAIKQCIEAAEEQPTAYDIDKIVEELESFVKLAEDRWTNGTSKYAYQEHKCWIKAIEIVKHGGVTKDCNNCADYTEPDEVDNGCYFCCKGYENNYETKVDNGGVSDDVCEPSADKIKVTSLEVIVTGSKRKPYYEIKYKEVGTDNYNIGYSSYNLDFVLDWKEKCFELVKVVE